jgi:hypothetical protein
MLNGLNISSCDAVFALRLRFSYPKAKSQKALGCLYSYVYMGRGIEGYGVIRHLLSC